MYISWFKWMIFFVIVHVILKIGVTITLQIYQYNGILPLTRLKQGSYPVIAIHARSFIKLSQVKADIIGIHLCKPVDWCRGDDVPHHLQHGD